MNRELMTYIPDADYRELDYLEMIVHDLDETDRRVFLSSYKKKRQTPQTILILSLLGFVGAHGIQRFFLGQIGMGLLYFFTAGLCFIGTIIDIANYKQLAWEHNRKKAEETYLLLRGGDDLY